MYSMRVFRGKCFCLPACLPIWIGERAFLRQRRSKALPLLILGFIKIRKGSSWHVGILDFPLFMQLKVSDWRVSKRDRRPLNSNPGPACLLLIRSSFHREEARIRCTW